MFFQVDDKMWSNKKFVDMIDEQGWQAAAGAVALWTLAGSHARGSGLDGVLTQARISRLVGGMAPEQAAAASALLVKYGLWHVPGHDCEKCPPVEPGTFLFHQWFQFKYATAAAERETAARMRELREASIVEAVWARDTDPQGIARCRYCAKEVKRPQRGAQGGARRGNDIGQLDHIDPTKAIGATNIVVACPECNQKKSQRTPEQAGMRLRPAPTRQRADQVNDQVPIKSESKPEVSPARARPRTGGGGVGTGVGVGVEPGEAHQTDPRPQGRAGPTPTVATPALFGSPWKDHHGPPPPPDLVEQATCPDHDLPRPCRRCTTTIPAALPTDRPTPPADPPTPPPGSRPRSRGSRGGRRRMPKSGDS